MSKPKYLLPLLVTFVSTTAMAAEITDVSSAADTIRIGNFEKDNPFDIRFGSTIVLGTHNGKITREPMDRNGVTAANCSEANARDCLPVDELRYRRNTSTLRLNLEIGIFHDLAFTLGWSYVIADNLNFRYADGVGPQNSTVDPVGGATGNPNDRLFAHDYASRNNGSGPLELGLRWAPLSDIRDVSKPMWLLFFNWASPWTQSTFNPAVHAATPSDPAPVGDGIHRLTFGTALSKRIANFNLIGIDPDSNRRGYLDPYISFSYTMPVPQRSLVVDALMPGETFSAKPSHIATVQAGFEVVPLEDLKNSRKIAIDLGLLSTYFSEGRNYSILTNPLQRLTYTDQYMYIGGLVGIYVQAAEFIRIRAGLNIGHNTEHFLTNEEVGRDVNQDGQVMRPEDDPNPIKDELNPYFCGNTPGDACSTDGRGQAPFDQVGFRFRNEAQFLLSGFITIIFTF